MVEKLSMVSVNDALIYDLVGWSQSLHFLMIKNFAKSFLCFLRELLLSNNSVK